MTVATSLSFRSWIAFDQCVKVSIESPVAAGSGLSTSARTLRRVVINGSMSTTGGPGIRHAPSNELFSATALLAFSSMPDGGGPGVYIASVSFFAIFTTSCLKWLRRSTHGSRGPLVGHVESRL